MRTSTCRCAQSLLPAQSCRVAIENGTSGTEDVRFSAHVRAKSALLPRAVGKPAKMEHRAPKMLVSASLRAANVTDFPKLQGNRQNGTSAPKMFTSTSKCGQSLSCCQKLRGASENGTWGSENVPVNAHAHPKHALLSEVTGKPATLIIGHRK
jgi:hypothetical protein